MVTFATHPQQCGGVERLHWINLDTEGSDEIAASGKSLARDEIHELVALAIEAARRKETPFDDLWLQLTNRGQQYGARLFALTDTVTCMIDIHPASCGVAVADRYLAEGIRIPWTGLGMAA